MKNRNITLITISLVLGCLALLPKAQAVSPAPDGCYPGFTTAEGCNALKSLTSGAGNTGLGWDSLSSNTTGGYNTAVGAGTLILNNGTSNTAVGAAALLLNTTGTQNTAVGTDAMVYNDGGYTNTAVGTFALYSNTFGSVNVANGVYALYYNTSGNENVANGSYALQNNTTGSANTALGQAAGYNLDTGSGNVSIGANVTGFSGESNTTRIRNIGSTPIVGGTTVVVAGTGGIGDQRLGYASSSRRYKEEIKPMDKASETLFALKPVTFRAKGNMDPAHVKHYGLIAEDVAAVDSNLVVYNPEGKPETLRFDSINAMLLNEFLKEHRKVEEQQAAITALKSIVAHQQRDFQAAIAEQQKEFEARLKQQDAMIQRVNAQLELNKLASRTVSNNP